ncbi:MAG: formylglycine-generating enzyme required for sulfatase activity/TolB-like protein [Bradymonadia bacterium]
MQRFASILLSLVLSPFALSSTTMAAPPKLAVLELNNRAGISDAEARYLTDRVRAAAVRARYFVLSRENILEHLPPGTTLAACEGDCEVQTARNVGADQVVSGEIINLGKELRVALRLHETQAGRLLNTARVAGAIEDIDAPLEEAAQQLFVTRPPDPRIVVHFKTTPARARVLVDGAVICTARTVDCRVRMQPGEHRVTLSAPGHSPLERVEQFTDSTNVHWRLAPTPRPKTLRPGALAHRLGWIGIPSGIFAMGDADRGGSATPVHAVRVGRFSLMRAEVTTAQFTQCVRAGACSAPRTTSPRCTWRGRSDLPMNCVSVQQAKAFCGWVGGRLPSESEWEYAARDRRDQPHPWGRWRGPSCERVVMRDAAGAGCGRKAPSPVCSRPAGNTESGLCDIEGNLSEFVADCWHRDYHGAPGGGMPWTDACHADAVVVRGGGYVDDRSTLHVAERRIRRQGAPRVDIGFRCAR